MEQTDKERAQTERLENDYEMARSPVIQKITNKVCGCGYIGSSWTTKSEAEKLLKYLKLDENDILLEIGAGAGWPGLYLAKQSGCHVTLLDIPVTGLEIAKKRAKDDLMSDRVRALSGDAASLPFQIPSFSVVSHSDVLCCLIKKQEVLKECRRVIHSSGLMAFTVISIQTDLSDREKKQALQVSPDFVETEVDYPTMLENTGWRSISYEDITEESVRSMISLVTGSVVGSKAGRDTGFTIFGNKDRKKSYINSFASKSHSDIANEHREKELHQKFCNRNRNELEYGSQKQK